MKYTEELQEALSKAVEYAGRENHRYLMPEHLLWAFTFCHSFAEACLVNGGDAEELRADLEEWLAENAEPRGEEREGLEMTEDFKRILIAAESQASASGRDAVEISHIMAILYLLEDSYAVYFLEKQGIDQVGLLGDLSRGSIAKDPKRNGKYEPEDSEITDGFRGEENSEAADGFRGEESSKDAWRRYLECMNDTCMDQNPLIGRERELSRTIQILCRMEKNNVLHIGEPGVGKTAIAYGLARRIEEGKVPQVLAHAKIYSLDLGGLLAGTQFRGDFEKRFQMIMNGLLQEDKPILYLDEIHNIVGAGAVNGGSLDVSNLLKPYLAGGRIRFIGATTYEEYKKHLSLNKGLMRRFGRIDIPEPKKEEALAILKGLQPRYEAFHGVVYARGVLEYAIEASMRYGNERFLPDKAIDLIDEAGAMRKLNPMSGKMQYVRKDLIDEILAQSYQVPKRAVERDDRALLASLERRMKRCVFGQEEAVLRICDAVKFAKAGLNEEGKPVASFLFVGPTGVGKTESAKALASLLGISLVRFDMSEYSEKHAVAKLIGAPAGYVGYEEGGLLTEEIRRHPHCVLLLDEIEKAHPDIYNVLLSVMDYATLTDNQGRRADFRNVILIMTSNAGAGRLGKQKIGFGAGAYNREAVEEAVKQTFQPEFRNRLSRIVIFNGMDERMAEQITEKKLQELKSRLSEQNVTLTVTKRAKEWIRKAGITQEYGAREIDRVIAAEVKPLLADELLFGSLKKGGACLLEEEKGKLVLAAGKSGQRAEKRASARKRTSAGKRTSEGE